ncbi:UDP-N-acetylglucosamine 2-epimerase [Bacillus sp. FJAT-28004]|uniref:UDP-N-acetylglucosamine 2-epimerase n=1 Tax=Bacillus sp. FJAT-28004 TaxID=1679165 RepID=UPI0006B5112D|nr:UDP-N-acetylglucosamine 2-epimerase [Bacillus sp. FJAT-28004]
MYGEEKLNTHNLLRYGLTKEFFEQFHAIRHKGIEIPLTLIRPFHVYIKKFINGQMTSPSYVAKIKGNHKLVTMRDVQSALLRKPKIQRDLSKVSRRTTTIMPAKLIDFALDKMVNQAVILVVADRHDRAALKGKRLPRNFKLFNYIKAIRAQRISPKITRKLKRSIRQLTVKNGGHPIFGTRKFSKWLYAQSVKSIKTINALENLIRKKPVGVLIDHVEIVNPGTTFALLANKFNLPFINFPQLLIADRSLIPTRASYHFVWGKNYKEWLERRGIHSGKIIITGNLRFEHAKQEVPSTKEKFLARSNVPTNHTIVLYTTQPFEASVSNEIMRWISSASNHSQPVTFLIKPHPNDTVDYSKYTASPQVKLLSKDAGLYDALSSADIVMTISSNTAIEAAMLDKAIIVLQPPIPYNYDHHNNDFNQHLVTASAGLVARNSKQLSSYVSKFIRSEALRNLLVKQSKQFLSNTLQTSKSPADEAFKMIRNLISQKSSTSSAVRPKRTRKRKLRRRRK